MDKSNVFADAQEGEIVRHSCDECTTDTPGTVEFECTMRTSLSEVIDSLDIDTQDRHRLVNVTDDSECAVFQCTECGKHIVYGNVDEHPGSVIRV